VLGIEAAHLVQAEFPLLPLADLALPVFEDAAGQRYWEPSPRRAQHAAWWKDCRRRSLSTLLVVSDDSYQVVFGEGQAPPFAWPPPGAEELTDHPRLEIQVVTLDELAQLAADVGLEPVRFSRADGQPRYLMHDARGFRCAQLNTRDASVDRLKQAIATALGVKTDRLGGERK
jgi:hypothetical protein